MMVCAQQMWPVLDRLIRSGEIVVIDGFHKASAAEQQILQGVIDG
jgi:hypothetical protein